MEYASPIWMREAATNNPTAYSELKRNDNAAKRVVLGLPISTPYNTIDAEIEVLNERSRTRYLSNSFISTAQITHNNTITQLSINSTITSPVNSLFNRPLKLK